ncbi:hypothetical protein CONLIGDRAFT_476211 [Coniochaeta ligniaria NRRL 30616]|uniref:PA14 domain-containing protein n=1 Tax=Coniochaeta ligniaria NRRL 30616 TaxID=1408157 RepID=A0A1J7IGD7_9PEZI|nr:hypothetical protein CONLIGDRAFT_476211 [Coniochaeta ligniaria NRRL 30616]
MKLSNLLSLCVAAVASAAVLERRANCDDNCGRQIAATRAGAVDPAIRSADCSKAVVNVVTVTVTPTVTGATVTATTSTTSSITVSQSTTTVTTTTVAVFSTVTTTDVSTSVTLSTVLPVLRREEQRAEKRALTTSVPAYASSCTKPGAYASACSCLLGHSISTSTSTVTVTASAVGASVTTTTTAVVTATSTVSVVYTSTSSEFTTDLETATVETTTTSTLVCTATGGAPPIVLASPTGVVSEFNGQTSPYNIDDTFYKVSLPFPISIYGVSSADVFVAINGLIFVQDPTGPVVTADTSAADASKQVGYTNGPFPQYCPGFTGSYWCSSALPYYTVAPFWDDLYIYANTLQGLYYEVDGMAPHRSVTFEWYTSHYQAPTEYYHFTITFSEASPGAWTAAYYQISDSGSSASVGLQGGAGGPFAQYSFNTPDITNGLVLYYDPGSNTITTSGAAVC